MLTKKEILKKSGYVPKLGRPKKFFDSVVFSLRIEKAIFAKIPEPKCDSVREILSRTYGGGK